MLDAKSVWVMSSVSVALLAAPATAVPLPEAENSGIAIEESMPVAIDAAVDRASVTAPEQLSPDFSLSAKNQKEAIESAVLTAAFQESAPNTLLTEESQPVEIESIPEPVLAPAPDLEAGTSESSQPLSEPTSIVEASIAAETSAQGAVEEQNNLPVEPLELPAVVPPAVLAAPEVPEVPIEMTALGVTVPQPEPQLYGEVDESAVTPLENGEAIAPAAVASDPLGAMTAEEWESLVNGSDEPDPVSLAADELPTRPAAEPAAAAELANSDLEPIAEAQRTESAAIAPDWSENAMAQVTAVSQLSDVQPTDWAFQALQSLVERYGAIAGYPDGTFRGDRALTRYEFAAGLNAALDAITQQIAVATEAQPTPADLETLQRLSDDFAVELAAIRGRVDSLEARTAALEANQFSTTAVLGGQVVLGLAAAGGGDPPGTGEGNAVLTHLTLLQLAASFTGRDVLRIGLSAGNFNDRGFANPQSLNTNMALLAYQTDTDNEFDLDSLEYRFAVGDRLVVTVKPVGFSLSTVLSPNSIFSSSSNGALSRFAGFSPVYRIGSLDAGVGADFLVTNRLRLQVAYGARDASSGEDGLFSSNHRALGVQLLAQPSNNLTTGIAYVNAFARDGRLDTFTGSNNADTSGGFNEPAAIHAITGTLQWEVTPNLVLGTWGGAIVTDSLRSNAVAFSTTYLFSLGLTDPFGREGDLLGILVGQPPRLGEGFLIEREDDGTSMHYEAFYRFRVTDYLTITPGFFIVTDPGHISENDTIFVTALRTTFSF